jgi:alcohol dehydrogenase (cytochrome c)
LPARPEVTRKPTSRDRPQLDLRPHPSYPCYPLVFSGGINDRKIHAFDVATGKLFWEFPTSSGILGPPTSFMVDGKQYIAMHSGWGGDSRGMQATLNRLFPGEYPEVPEGGSIWVFALE